MMIDLRKPATGSSFNVFVSGTNVQIRDSLRGRTTSSSHPTPEAARAAAEAFVAARVAIGYEVQFRSEGPTPVSGGGSWSEWLESLQTVWGAVVDDAAAAGVACDMERSRFSRGLPEPRPGADAAYGADLAGLDRATSGVRMSWHLGDDALRFDAAFVVGVLDSGGRVTVWMRENSGHIESYGVWERGLVHTRPAAAGIASMDLASFRAWFPRWVRHDVMAFTIAELTRR